MLTSAPESDPPHPPYDVFVSHSSVDKPRGRTLVRNLERRGLRVFFDEAAMVPGRSIVDGLWTAMHQVPKAILVVTADAGEPTR